MSTTPLNKTEFLNWLMTSSILPAWQMRVTAGLRGRGSRFLLQLVQSSLSLNHQRRCSVEILNQRSKQPPTRPDHLNDIVQAKWSEITAQLDQMGLFSSADQDALELYCSAYSRYRSAESMVRKFGQVIVSP